MNKLKGMILGAVLAMVLSVNVFADESVKLKSVGISSGQGALTSGLFLETNFINGNDLFNVSLGGHDLYGYYWKSLVGDRLYAGPCLEFFYNVPVVSFMVFQTPVKNYITALSWIGYSAGTPDEKIEPTNWKLLYIYQSLIVSYKRFTATTAIMYFAIWQGLIDVQYNQPVTKKVNLFIDAGRNITTKVAILKMGVVYNP